MADDSLLLSDLCSICNTTKFKYRCPGCAARTCSLPCYKRHQQWAQCNGKRDPTKFVKKSQLETPAGIDHDFNFLTGIERGLEKAARSVEGTSSGTASDLRHRRPVDQRLAATGVTVIRAPKGLSRQKDNKTSRTNTLNCTRKGNIIWTVEWIRDDKTRILNQSSELAPLLQSLPFKPEISSKKRKFKAEKLAATTVSADQDGSVPTVAQEGEPRDEAAGKKPRLPTPGRSGADFEDSNTCKSGDSHSTEVASHDDSSPAIHGTSPESVPPKYDFFLLRPRTSSSRRVIIPIDPHRTLADCLRGHTVLEFPTIYLFPESTKPPPEDFMLNDEYARQEGEEQKEFEDLIQHVGPEALRAIRNDHEDDKAGEELDSKKILDVLKQDISAGL
ncbi:HIT finger domain-containing protein [Massarina eburnea CBS 473.64]|uniref:Box C/D snoRNA protein 1 n=1 Tax=Massarina eburnea CBS 473.64 TaxID=1395130 RepID=A0A6A6RSC7_9PLEO|nr:HIT finger domain-containing protein [Massarina eburnea CBS 473.64]